MQHGGQWINPLSPFFFFLSGNAGRAIFIDHRDGTHFYLIFKEEFQYLYKGGIERLRYIHSRYANPEDINS